jgi:hypothetical protein
LLFVESVLSDHVAGEQMDPSRLLTSETVEDLVRFIENNGDAISFFGYSYFYQNKDILLPVPIQNGQGTYVSPSEETIRDASYNPFVRSIYMNLLIDAERLKYTAPFIRFGLMARQLVSVTGYIPVSEEAAFESLFRLENVRHDLEPTARTERKSRKVGIAVGTIVGMFIIGMGAFYANTRSFASRQWRVHEPQASGNLHVQPMEAFRSGRDHPAGPEWARLEL